VKVLLNVAREHFQIDEWFECEGIKFEERDDGSFDLISTSDLARMRKSDAEMAALTARIKEQSNA
jgi:hypothetical protein